MHPSASDKRKSEVKCAYSNSCRHLRMEIPAAENTLRVCAHVSADFLFSMSKNIFSLLDRISQGKNHCHRNSYFFAPHDNGQFIFWLCAAGTSLSQLTVSARTCEKCQYHHDLGEMPIHSAHQARHQTERTAQGYLKPCVLCLALTRSPNNGTHLKILVKFENIEVLLINAYRLCTGVYVPGFMRCSTLSDSVKLIFGAPARKGIVEIKNSWFVSIALACAGWLTS